MLTMTEAINTLCDKLVDLCVSMRNDLSRIHGDILDNDLKAADLKVTAMKEELLEAIVMLKEVRQS